MKQKFIRLGDTTQVEFTLYNTKADGSKALFTEAEMNSLTAETVLLIRHQQYANSPVIEVTVPYTERLANQSKLLFKLNGNEVANRGYVNACVKCVFGDGNKFTTTDVNILVV